MDVFPSLVDAIGKIPSPTIQLTRFNNLSGSDGKFECPIGCVCANPTIVIPAIHVEESPRYRVVITALEIIKSCIYVIVVAAIADRVDVYDVWFLFVGSALR